MELTDLPENINTLLYYERVIDSKLYRWPDMKNGYQHAFQNQLFLCAYLHDKRVMLLARERVITCRVRAFPWFLEIRGGSQIIIPRMICDRKQNQALGKKVFLRADIHYFERLN